MSFTFYKVLHILGLLMTFLALGGVIQHFINEGDKNHRWKIGAAVTHGLGLVLVLISGFGMLAKKPYLWPYPGWAFAKLGIWLLLGGALAAAIRLKGAGRVIWGGVLGLGAVAAYLAVYRPF